MTINVEYCLYSEDSSLSLKLIIEDEEKKIFKIFERMGKCIWTYPIDEYKYIKFILVLAKDDSILRWNTNYFVEYNITELNEYFKEEKSANGIKYINSPNDNFQTIMYIKNGGSSKLQFKIDSNNINKIKAGEFLNLSNNYI